MSRKAFTLIELLVVIAILAALAAILFPVLARARERARVVHCISNMRQIGVAVGQYLSDWDDRYPYAYTDYSVVKYGAHPAFRETMTAYAPDKRIWQCPSDSGEIFLIAGDSYAQQTPPFHSDDWAMSSYGYLGVGFQKKDGRIGGYAASRIKRPGLAVLSFEPRPWHGGYDPMIKWFVSSPALVNVLYCDGHVARRTRLQWGDDAVAGVQP